MKIKKILIVFLWVSLVAQGQNTFNGTYYWLQMPMINPAASGVTEKLDMALGTNFSQQSIGYNPLFFRADFKSTSLNSGFGFSYFNDNMNALLAEEAPVNNGYAQTLRLNYNYQISLKTGILSVGANGQYHRNTYSTNWVTPDSPIDPAIPQEGFQDYWTLGFGAQFTTEKWHVGASYSPAIPLTNEDGLEVSDLSYFNINGAYKFNLTEKWQLEPGINYGIGSSSQSLSSYFQFIYHRWAHIGASISEGGTLPDMGSVFAGVKIVERLYFQYGYGIFISSTTNNAPQHTVALRFTLPDIE